MSIAKIHIQDEQCRTVVMVIGEIDMTVGPALTTALSDAVAQATFGHVSVDLSQVSFMDATGIHALTDGMRAATAAAVTFRVTGATGIVAQVLDVTGLLAILTAKLEQPTPQPATHARSAMARPHLRRHDRPG